MKLFGMTINVCTVSIFVFSLKTLNLIHYIYIYLTYLQQQLQSALTAPQQVSIKLLSKTLIFLKETFLYSFNVK